MMSPTTHTMIATMKTYQRPITPLHALSWMKKTNTQHLMVLFDTGVGMVAKICKSESAEGFATEYCARTGAEAGRIKFWSFADLESYVQQGTINTGTSMETVDTTDTPAQPVNATVLSEDQFATVLQMIQDAVAGVSKPVLTEWLKNADEKLKSKLDAFVKPNVIEVIPSDGEPVNIGVQHHNFEMLLKKCNTRDSNGNRLNIWLYGPSGTGKTHSAKAVAKALNLSFQYNGAIDTKFELFGFINATGQVVRTPFREAWENGGVYLFDEIDGSNENAVLAFNGALSNGYAPFPDATVPRHKDCIILAGANTLGAGATAEYNGRNRMDKAFKDRFINQEWPIDEELERQISGNEKWARRVQAIRAKAETLNIRNFMISPRASINGAALLAVGIPQKEVEESVIRQGLDDNAWKNLLQGI